MGLVCYVSVFSGPDKPKTESGSDGDTRAI